MESQFPDRKHEGINGISELLEELKRYGYTTLVDIDAMLSASIDAVLAEEGQFPPVEKNTSNTTQYSTVGLTRTALIFMSAEYLNDAFGEERVGEIERFRHLIKKSQNNK